MEMGTFDLVIFDCDGVLVDSECQAVRTEAEILTNLGWHSPKLTSWSDLWVGRPPTCNQEIEQRASDPLEAPAFGSADLSLAGAKANRVAG